MKIKPISEEDKRNLAVLKEKLVVVTRESDEAFLLASERRKEVSKLRDEYILLTRDICVKVGGNTNWQVDESGEHIVEVGYNSAPYYGRY